MSELIDRLRKKDEEAFKEVMRMYRKAVLNYLHLLVNNRELAEELAQDTFVKVYFKAHTLTSDNLKSWIYTIATNLARSHFRRQKIKRMLSLADVNEAHVAVASRAENGVILQQVLAALPEKYREPLLMKEIDNFSFEEIANVLGKPVGTVKSLVFRARVQAQALCNGQQRPLAATANLKGDTHV